MAKHGKKNRAAEGGSSEAELVERVGLREYFRKVVHPKALQRLQELLQSTNAEIRTEAASILLEKFDPQQLHLLKAYPERAIERARQIIREQKEREQKLHPPN